MFLRDKGWARLVKTNHFPPITILLWGDLERKRAACERIQSDNDAIHEIQELG